MSKPMPSSETDELAEIIQRCEADFTITGEPGFTDALIQRIFLYIDNSFLPRSKVMEAIGEYTNTDPKLYTGPTPLVEYFYHQDVGANKLRKSIREALGITEKEDV